MSAHERLQAVQSALEKQGVTDVKFCFARVADTPCSEVLDNVADFLEAYLGGGATLVDKIGDSKKQ